MESTSFSGLGLSDTTLQIIKNKGFEEPTEIQLKTIPLFLSSQSDIVGQAQTGTGKTAAFGLPILEKITGKTDHVQALILVPTRELAIQVAEELNSLKGKKKLDILPIYGGQSITEQIRRLNKGVDIVVGTPGRILDHCKKKKLILDKVTYSVLDEADEMLNMGFIEDIETILEFCNTEKRMLLFSATMPSRILKISKKYMGDYKIIETRKDKLTVEQTDQIYFEVNSTDKFEALCRIIDIENEFYGLIFCRTKLAVDELTTRLIERGYDAEGIHGDISQNQREITMKKFKNKHVNILVATDVAARGIDVTDLTHVINYSLPQDPESYIHRIGRTGRAGKKGIAITFISPSEYRKLSSIVRVTKTEIRKEKVPSVSEIIAAKKLKIESDIQAIAEKGPIKEYLKTADKLLEGQDPRIVLASLLEYTFQDELDKSSYSDLKQQQTISVDVKGTTRLFVALGKKDGISPKKLVKFIQNETKIQAGKISNIAVKNTYSFITVPFREAEIILKSFQKHKKSGKPPLIDVAENEKKSNKKKKSKK